MNPTPEPTAAYRRGYLCGLIRGDGHLGTYAGFDRGNRGTDVQDRFRLALADTEPLQRATDYLAGFGVAVTRFLFTAERPGRRRMEAIRTSSAESETSIRELIEWPDRTDSEWDRGFLAGLFDAEGSFSRGILRIHHSDGSLLAHGRSALRAEAFDATTDHRPTGVHAVRIRGGLREHLRFIQWTDPAIPGKRDIAGARLKSPIDLRIADVEPLGRTIPMVDITTETGDFVANGVVSHNCYARPSHEYLGFSAGLDFESRILVKTDAPRLLAAAFRKPSWEPQVVALSGNTDPYQPVERRLGLTRRCLEVFARYRNPVSIITKNHLVTRDLDLLAEMASLHLVHVSVSVTSLDDGLIGTMEPRTSRPSRRLDAIRALAGAGIPVGVMVAPVIPGLTDEEMPAILEAAAAAGARRAGYIVLRLPGVVEPLFAEWLRREHPLRAGKVLARVRSLRGGRLNDSRFGVRMRGEGPWAEVFRRMFHMTVRRLGLNAVEEPLSTAHFRRDQLSLF